MSDFELSRNSFGRLVLKAADGRVHEGVVAVRAFPIAAPDEGISLVGSEGHELVWIARLDDLPDDMRRLVGEELAQREFVPVIERLVAVSTFATPSYWRVTTDHGETEFILRGEEDIRRIGHGKLLIGDSHGMQYLVPDLYALDGHSRKLLDRFL
ncbi:MAG: DUF1854 domain-containing protein [Gammaproteobacteria bacterium]|nr:DUF1854 domain-containing protein [Gammaproteobacteria bacterium]MBU1645087.1 DUF1854 domain-containing protein [Gammaproteobacteria bacterium]MBU1973324.1 DUF1854 domain-containing protein [Gammaproteobacteria bacterium]